MTGPLTLTTRHHPLAVSTLAAQLLLGVAYVSDLAEPTALDSLMSGVFPLLWSVGVAAAAAIGLASLLVHNLPRAMTLELAGLGTLTGLNTIYVLSLIAGYGWFGVPITTIAFLSFTVGFGWRAVQIIREMRRLRAAVASPVLADPPALGEPSGDAKE